MNENVIFLVGIIIFAITIYGTVMAGGIALTKVAVDEAALPSPDAVAPPTAASIDGA